MDPDKVVWNVALHDEKPSKIHEIRIENIDTGAAALLSGVVAARKKNRELNTKFASKRMTSKVMSSGAFVTNPHYPQFEVDAEILQELREDITGWDHGMKKTLREILKKPSAITIGD
ncbi:hypothetical protein FI667_g3321, partial [Globisporangium splendens]